MSQLAPLTSPEIQKCVDLVNAIRINPVDGKDTIFAEIVLDEPSKTSIVNNTPIKRTAKVLVYQNSGNRTVEYIVNLTDEIVTSTRTLRNVIPGMNDRYNATTIMENPMGFIGPNIRRLITSSNSDAEKFCKGLRKRGISVFDVGDEPGRRYRPCVDCTYEALKRQSGQSDCKQALKSDQNGRYFLLVLIDTAIDPIDGYIDGLIALIDITIVRNDSIGRIVRTIDEFINKPLNISNFVECDLQNRNLSLKPLITTQPEGPSYIINGNILTWDNWSMELSWHPHSGLQLYLIQYFDGTLSEFRPILYKASVSESYVVYHTQNTISFRNFISLDSASVPLMFRLTSLILGKDVPDHATLLDIPDYNIDGSPSTLTNVIGIYEEDGDLLWRADSATVTNNIQRPCGVRGRKLVLRTIYTSFFNVWIFTWKFSQDGIIEAFVDVSGRTINQYLNDDITPNDAIGLGYFGSFITTNKFGLNHSHISNYRLDFMIDGINNSIIESNWIPITNDRKNKCGLTIHNRRNVIEEEKDARRDVDISKNRTWTVINPNNDIPNIEDTHTGYMLMPAGNNDLTAVDSDSALDEQFKFTRHNLHVTRYKEDEQFAGGEYPTQQRRDTGIGKYDNDDQRIKDRDIVVWYNIGLTHTPSTEYFPVRPVVGSGFKLMPQNFFCKNPASDIDSVPI